MISTLLSQKFLAKLLPSKQILKHAVLLFLIGIFVFSALAPVGIHAQIPAPVEVSSTGGGPDQALANLKECGFLTGASYFSLFCVGKLFATILSWVMGLFGWAVYAAAKIMTISMAITFDGAFLNAPAVITGWTIVRDIANIAFIFVLLAIAIATVLQLETFNAKRILPKIVLAALLINFSFALAKLPIDATNILALSFYEATGATPSAELQASNLKIRGDIGGRIVGALQPQKIYEPAAGGVAITGTDSLQKIMSIIITFLLGMIVLAFLVYFFIMASVIFITRIVVLWALLILSPLAVVAWAIGNSQWNVWLKKLLNQALVAPVLLFFLYITIVIADSGFLQDTLGTSFAVSDPGVTGNTTGVSAFIADGFGSVASTSVRFLTQYAILVGFLYMGLKVAKDLGGIGADALISGGKSTWKAAAAIASGGGIVVGAVGAGSAAAVNRATFGKSAGRGTQVLKKIDESSSFPARFIRRVPGVSTLQKRLVQPGIDYSRTVAAKEEETVKSFNKKQIRSRAAAASADQRVGQLRALAKIGGVEKGEGFTKAMIESTLRHADRTGQKTSDIIKSNFSFAPVLKEEDESDFDSMYKVVGKLNVKNVDELSKSVVDDDVAMEAFALGLRNANNVSAVWNRGDEVSDAYVDKLKGIKKHIEDNTDFGSFEEGIEKGGFTLPSGVEVKANPELAKALAGTPRLAGLRARLGMSEPKKKGDSGKDQDQPQKKPMVVKDRKRIAQHGKNLPGT